MHQSAQNSADIIWRTFIPHTTQLARQLAWMDNWWVKGRSYSAWHWTATLEALTHGIVWCRAVCERCFRAVQIHRMANCGRNWTKLITLKAYVAILSQSHQKLANAVAKWSDDLKFSNTLPGYRMSSKITQQFQTDRTNNDVLVATDEISRHYRVPGRPGWWRVHSARLHGVDIARRLMHGEYQSPERWSERLLNHATLHYSVLC